MGMQSWQSRLYLPRARTISRSTLADANAKRPAQIYADVYQALVKQARPGVRRKMKDAVRLIDSSRLRLTGRSESWARPIRNHHFAKIRVIYDPHAMLPLKTVVTANTVSDLTPAKAMDIEPGVTYVFDLAYYKYDWWHKLDAAGCRFVTRMKTFTKLTKPQNTRLARVMAVFWQTGVVCLRARLNVAPMHGVGPCGKLSLSVTVTSHCALSPMILKRLRKK